MRSQDPTMSRRVDAVSIEESDPRKLEAYIAHRKLVHAQNPIDPIRSLALVVRM
jgi:hypothetical protein